MKPKYEYFLQIDDQIIGIKVRVAFDKTTKLFQIQQLNPISIVISGSKEADMYRVFEDLMLDTLMRFHIAGKLYKQYPEYTNSNLTEVCRLICIPRRPWYKRLFN